MRLLQVWYGKFRLEMLEAQMADLRILAQDKSASPKIRQKARDWLKKAEVKRIFLIQKLELN